MLVDRDHSIVGAGGQGGTRPENNHFKCRGGRIIYSDEDDPQMPHRSCLSHACLAGVIDTGEMSVPLGGKVYPAMSGIEFSGEARQAIRVI